MRLAMLLALGVAALYVLHRLALRAEERGWIYYVKRRGSSSSLSSAMLQVQSILEPSRRHVIEERTRERAEHEVGGKVDPPDKHLA